LQSATPVRVSCAQSHPDAEDAQGRCQIEMRCVELGMSHFVVEPSVSFFVTNGFVCADLDRKRP
jgi:hypothetical protein